MVRRMLQGSSPFVLALVVVLASDGCASPDASRLEQARDTLPNGQADSGTGGRKDAGPAIQRDAARPGTGTPADAGFAGDAGDCSGGGEFPLCVRPNALTTCADGRCLIVRCDGDFVDCDGDPGNGCEATLDTLDNCGLCRAECRFPNAIASCADGTCLPVGCATGFDNCDNEDDNGCETAIDTPQRCGDCDTACPTPSHGRPGCANGACGVGSCDPGWGDCNTEASDGCEQPLNDSVHCGGCDKPCDPANGSGDCGSGSCQITACDADYVDCNGLHEDGCETAAASAQNCCAAGSADCDANPDNGCEASFDQPRTCGSCGNDCLALAHVAGASCVQGSCEALLCDDGWADCDGIPSNGCERSLRTLTDCGGCNVSCTRAHGTTSCSTGTCTLVGCDSGYANCNDNPADGCEASLSQPESCGSCTTRCPGDSSCVNGNCRCTSSADCTQGRECCDGVCQDTRGSCFPWPCIPGTGTGKNNHCGGCDVLCGLWCCL